jgi:hypothetical protein
MDGKIESIINKVLEGNASSTEREALAAWIRIGPENEAEFESFKILCGEEIPESAETQLDFYSEREKLMGKIHSLELKKRRTVRVRTLISIALFVIAILFSLWNLFDELKGAPLTRRFENASIGTVEQFLTENWTVKFSFENGGLGNCRFDGFVLTGSGDEETLKAVLTAMRLSYKVEPSGFFLISGSCGN